MRQILILLKIYFLFTLVIQVSVEAGEIHQTIDQAYQLHNKKNPNSCESVYYGLFVHNPEYFEPNSKEIIFNRNLWQELDIHPKANLSVYGVIQLVDIEKIRLPRKDALKMSEVRAKVFDRNAGVKLTKQSLENKNKALLNEVKKIYNDEIISLNPILATLKGFWDKGQEKAIRSEWAQRVQKTEMVFDPEGGGAFYKKSKIHSDLEARHCMNCGKNKNEALDLNGEPIQQDLNKEYDTSIIWQSDRTLGVQTDSANVFVLSHELSHSIEWARDSVKQCLSSAESYGARLDSKQTAEKKIKSTLERFKEIFHMEFNSGYGTELVEDYKYKLLNQKASDVYKEVSEFEKSGNAPPQIAEAVADLYATEVTTKYIKKNYKTDHDKKMAALGVLYSFPPNLFTPEAEAVMNKAGSKKTNEQRVFKILLAHPEFRKILGCEFESAKVPPYCGK